ncbi:MAG TPA: hypothetical protein VNV87_12870 [Acidimicrobiales bacterium]|nr:hypothetical protein [Acidimicrobiales bacterium]
MSKAPERIDDAHRRPNRRTQDRLPSLIHELVDSDLVTRNAPGEWVLSAEMQSMLEEQMASRGMVRRRVFVGLHCEGCGVATVTWLSEGRRLCAACAEPTAEGTVIAPPELARHRSWRERGAHPFRRAG